MDRINVGGIEINVAKHAPGPDDGFLCSKCLKEGNVRDLHVIPSCREDGSWSGAFRCADCRAASYDAARAALSGETTQDQWFDFLLTVERWGPPLVALCPFTRGKSLERGALDVLDLLDRGAVRLSVGKPPREPGDGPEPVFLLVDMVLACLIAPRGHVIDSMLMDPTRAGAVQPVLLQMAIDGAMRALEPGDRVDADRWAELLRHADIEKGPDFDGAPPSAEQIAHWRAVALGATTVHSVE